MAFKWSKRTYNADLLVKYGDLSFPFVVRMLRTDTGSEGYEVFRVHSYVTQKRVLAKDATGRILSIPKKYAIKFELVDRTTNKRHKPHKLGRFIRMLESYKRTGKPLLVRMDSKIGWKFNIDETKNIDSLKFGTLELLERYTAGYLRSNRISQEGSLEKNIILLPVIANRERRIQVAVGIREEHHPADTDTDTDTEGAGGQRSQDRAWRALQQRYTECARYVKYHKINGLVDITIHRDNRSANVDQADTIRGGASSPTSNLSLPMTPPLLHRALDDAAPVEEATQTSPLVLSLDSTVDSTTTELRSTTTEVRSTTSESCSRTPKNESLTAGYSVATIPAAVDEEDVRNNNDSYAASNANLTHATHSDHSTTRLKRTVKDNGILHRRDYGAPTSRGNAISPDGRFRLYSDDVFQREERQLPMPVYEAKTPRYDAKSPLKDSPCVEYFPGMRLYDFEGRPVRVPDVEFPTPNTPFSLAPPTISVAPPSNAHRNPVRRQSSLPSRHLLNTLTPRYRDNDLTGYSTLATANVQRRREATPLNTPTSAAVRRRYSDAYYNSDAGGVNTIRSRPLIRRVISRSTSRIGDHYLTSAPTDSPTSKLYSSATCLRSSGGDVGTLTVHGPGLVSSELSRSHSKLSHSHSLHGGLPPQNKVSLPPLVTPVSQPSPVPEQELGIETIAAPVLHEDTRTTPLKMESPYFSRIARHSSVAAGYASLPTNRVVAAKLGSLIEENTLRSQTLKSVRGRTTRVKVVDDNVNWTTGQQDAPEDPDDDIILVFPSRKFSNLLKSAVAEQNHSGVALHSHSGADLRTHCARMANDYVTGKVGSSVTTGNQDTMSRSYLTGKASSLTAGSKDSITSKSHVMGKRGCLLTAGKEDRTTNRSYPSPSHLGDQSDDDNSSTETIVPNGEDRIEEMNENGVTFSDLNTTTTDSTDRSVCSTPVGVRNVNTRITTKPPKNKRPLRHELKPLTIYNFDLLSKRSDVSNASLPSKQLFPGANPQSISRVFNSEKPPIAPSNVSIPSCFARNMPLRSNKSEWMLARRRLRNASLSLETSAEKSIEDLDDYLEKQSEGLDTTDSLCI